MGPVACSRLRLAPFACLRELWLELLVHCMYISIVPLLLSPMQINQTNVHVTDFVLTPGTKITGQQQGNIAMMVDFLADPADSFSTQQVSGEVEPASCPTCCRPTSVSCSTCVEAAPDHISHDPAH